MKYHALVVLDENEKIAKFYDGSNWNNTSPKALHLFPEGDLISARREYGSFLRFYSDTDTRMVEVEVTIPFEFAEKAPAAEKVEAPTVEE